MNLNTFAPAASSHQNETAGKRPAIFISSFSAAGLSVMLICHEMKLSAKIFSFINAVKIIIRITVNFLMCMPASLPFTGIKKISIRLRYKNALKPRWFITRLMVIFNLIRYE